MTSALGIDGSRSTIATLQRSAASASSARSSVSARSIGESLVWAPGRSGGAARMAWPSLSPPTPEPRHSSSSSSFRALSARSRYSLIALAVAATSGTTRG